MVATNKALQRTSKKSGIRLIMGTAYEPFYEAVKGMTEDDWKELIASKYRPDVNFFVS